jgi:hypothetical protein
MKVKRIPIKINFHNNRIFYNKIMIANKTILNLVYQNKIRKTKKNSHKKVFFTITKVITIPINNIKTNFVNFIYTQHKKI